MLPLQMPIYLTQRHLIIFEFNPQNNSKSLK